MNGVTKTTRRSQAERVASTRRLLLDAAREIFGDKGYEAASTGEILEAAGLTRGALYHHFPDKRSLFLVVAAEVDRDLSERAALGSSSLPDPAEQLLTGIKIYLEGLIEPENAQILLLDGPSVIGWQNMTDPQLLHSVRGFTQLIARVRPNDSEQQHRILADLLSAMVDRTALLMATARDNPEQSQIAADALFLLVKRCLELEQVSIRHDRNQR